jgi:branched-chain amino acid transport system ATP-binding protein
MRPFVAKPALRAEPPKPAASPPVASAPAPAAAPARPGPGGIDIDSLVSRARHTAAATVSARPNGLNGARPPAPPPRPTGTPMPDLGSSADRLRAALAEIEEAARRAQAYRPPNRKP